MNDDASRPAPSPDDAEQGDGAPETGVQAGALGGPQAGSAPLVRVCPHCSVQSSSEGDFCPHCGGPYRRADSAHGAGSRESKGAWPFVVAGVAAVVAGAVVLAVVLSGDDTKGDGGSGGRENSVKAFLVAVKGDIPLGSAMDLLPPDSELLAAGELFCEARESDGPYNQGQLFVMDYLRPQVSEAEFETLMLVEDAAAKHLCPVEGLDD